MSPTYYSICIPHVFLNIPIKKIVTSFESYKIGKVSNVESVIKKSKEGYKYRMVFIHFSYWNTNNIAAVNLRNKIENPNITAKYVYDDPWYWIILPNTNQEYVYEKLNSIQPLFSSPLEDRIVQLENKINMLTNFDIHKFIEKNKNIDDYYDCESSTATLTDSDIDDNTMTSYNSQELLHLPEPKNNTVRNWMTTEFCDNL